MEVKRKTEEIRAFWNKNPVGTNFVDGDINKGFFIKYDRFRYATESHILDELNRIDFAGREVLEIGLGQGADGMQIIDRGGIYHGIDLTEASVNRVKCRFQFFKKQFKTIQEGDARSIPYPENYFDIVYSHGVIHHSPEIEDIVREIHRVLKPGGLAVVMLYHKNSINYYLSISFIRRMGLMAIYVFPSLKGFLSRVTGENRDRIQKHLDNFKREGLSYLKMKHLIHRSTDGPDNVFSSVWTRRNVKALFSDFKKIKTRVHFLNERHLLGLQNILPQRLKKKLAENYGWHLWVFATK